jgi:hypothetical protein
MEPSVVGKRKRVDDQDYALRAKPMLVAAA